MQDCENRSSLIPLFAIGRGESTLENASAEPRERAEAGRKWRPRVGNALENVRVMSPTQKSFADSHSTQILPSCGLREHYLPLRESLEENKSCLSGSLNHEMGDLLREHTLEVGPDVPTTV
jgi:hypothetical protein